MIKIEIDLDEKLKKRIKQNLKGDKAVHFVEMILGDFLSDKIKKELEEICKKIKWI